jgi:hypothetical protein
MKGEKGVWPKGVRCAKAAVEASLKRPIVFAKPHYKVAQELASSISTTQHIDLERGRQPPEMHTERIALPQPLGSAPSALRGGGLAG